MADLDPAVVAKLPITQDWTVVAFREGKTEPNPHGGQLTKFYVDFVGADETEVPDVYWRRKAGNTPDQNRPVYGTIMQGNYGPMFKIEQKDGSSFQQQQTSVPTQPQPEQFDRSRRIERQHSQEMALRLIAATGDAGDIDLSDSDLTGTYLNEVVKRLTDWFANDLEKR